MNRKVKTTASISQVKISPHWNWNAIGATESGRETTPVKCVIASPVAGSLMNRPMMAVTRIPIRIPPRTWSMTSVQEITRPMTASRPVPWQTSPRATSVESLFTIRPAFCRPMKAMNRPIPAPMACLSESGIALRIQVRTFVSVRTTKMRPSIRTAVRANCQEWPIVRQTVNTKKAFRPMPGASAKGFFAQKAITSVAMMAARAVAVKTLPAGIPGRALKMFGLTARM